MSPVRLSVPMSVRLMAPVPLMAPESVALVVLYMRKVPPPDRTWILFATVMLALGSIRPPPLRMMVLLASPNELPDA